MKPVLMLAAIALAFFILPTLALADVYDTGAVLSSDQIVAQINEKISAFETETGAKIVAYTGGIAVSVDEVQNLFEDLVGGDPKYNILILYNAGEEGRPLGIGYSIDNPFKDKFADLLAAVKPEFSEGRFDDGFSTLIALYMELVRTSGLRLGEGAPQISKLHVVTKDLLDGAAVASDENKLLASSTEPTAWAVFESTDGKFYTIGAVSSIDIEGREKDVLPWDIQGWGNLDQQVVWEAKEQVGGLFENAPTKQLPFQGFSMPVQIDNSMGFDTELQGDNNAGTLWFRAKATIASVDYESDWIRVSKKGTATYSYLVPGCSQKGECNDPAAEKIADFINTAKIFNGKTGLMGAPDQPVGEINDNCKRAWGADCADIHISTAWFSGIIGGSEPPCEARNAKSIGNAPGGTLDVSPFQQVVRVGDPYAEYEYRTGDGIAPIDVAQANGLIYAVEPSSKMLKRAENMAGQYSIQNTEMPISGIDPYDIKIADGYTYIASASPHGTNVQDFVYIIDPGYTKSYQIPMPGACDSYTNCDDKDSDPIGTAVSGDTVYVLTQDWETVLRFSKKVVGSDVKIAPENWKGKGTNRIYVGDKANDVGYTPQPGDCPSGTCTAWIKDIEILGRELFVSLGTDKIKVYNADTGELVREFGGIGHVQKLSVSGNSIWVADGAGALEQFSADGSLVRSIAVSAKEGKPVSVAPLSGDRFAVAINKNGNRRLLVFNSNGLVENDLSPKSGGGIYLAGENTLVELKIGLGENEIRPGDMLVVGDLGVGDFSHTEAFYKDNGNNILDGGDEIYQWGMAYNKGGIPFNQKFVIRRWRNLA